VKPKKNGIDDSYTRKFIWWKEEEESLGMIWLCSKRAISALKMKSELIQVELGNKNR